MFHNVFTSFDRPALSFLVLVLPGLSNLNFRSLFINSTVNIHMTDFNFSNCPSCPYIQTNNNFGTIHRNTTCCVKILWNTYMYVVCIKTCPLHTVINSWAIVDICFFNLGCYQPSTLVRLSTRTEMSLEQQTLGHNI